MDTTPVEGSALWILNKVGDSMGVNRGITEKFNALPGDTIEYLNELYEEEAMHSSIVFPAILRRMLIDGDDPVLVEDVSYYCYTADQQRRGLITTRFRPRKAGSERPVQYEPIGIDVTSLRYYPLSRFDYNRSAPIRKQSETVQSQCRALFALHTYSQLSEETFGSEPYSITANNTVRSIPLAQYVVDHHDRVDQIIDIIDERGADDVLLIDAILSSDASALGQGVL